MWIFETRGVVQKETKHFASRGARGERGGRGDEGGMIDDSDKERRNETLITVVVANMETPFNNYRKRGSKPD